MIAALVKWKMFEPVALPRVDAPGLSSKHEVSASGAHGQLDHSSGEGAAVGEELVTELPAKRRLLNKVPQHFALAEPAAAAGTEPALRFGVGRVPPPAWMKMPAVSAAAPVPEPENESTASSSPSYTGIAVNIMLLIVVIMS